MVHLVVALGDNPIAVNPHVAITRENVHVRFRFPVGVGLAAIGIAERDVHSREFFILQQNPDHF